jgi:serine/threonine-protein kinase
LKAGDVIGGKYRVERLLGEGGMGMVVAAHHVVLDQPVAVKLLYNDDEEAVSRLIIEAKSAARIPGEHVSRVLDIDRGPDGLPFIVMELLEGVDLYQVLTSQGPLPRWLVVDYMLQALMGLAGAHAGGIVHRDLKPSNLFLSRRPDGSEIIKVLDFGVSKSIVASEEDQRLTGAKAMLGSPPYMSPEQVRSPKSVDTRADIWAMGIVMFELLTARLPFRGQEVQETFAMILERQPPRLRELAPEVPAGLEEVVCKCLSKKREERYQTVHELASALVAFGSGTWTHAAEEIRRTLTRPLPEDTSQSRSKPGALISLREIDVQPTASTVIGKRKFPIAAEGSRSPLLIAAGIGLAAIVLLVFAVIQRQRNKALAAQLVDEAPSAYVASPLPGALPGPANGGALPPLVQTGQAPGVPPPLAQTGDALDLDDAGVTPGRTSSASQGMAQRPQPASPPQSGGQAAAAPQAVQAIPQARKLKNVPRGNQAPQPQPAGGSLPPELFEQK